jgi:transposase-like protein
MSESKRRPRYTLEYKLEAVRLVKGGQVAAVTAKILGIPRQTLENWVRLHGKGQLKGAGDKPVSPEQMELAGLRAENARLRMERDILGKATAYFARLSLISPAGLDTSNSLTERHFMTAMWQRVGL